MANTRIGLSDNWLRHVQDVREQHSKTLAGLTDPSHRDDRLCELNVIEQVTHVCQTSIVHDAWARSQPLAVHGWIYGLNNGLVRDLKYTVSKPTDVLAGYAGALAALTSPAT